MENPHDSTPPPVSFSLIDQWHAAVYDSADHAWRYMTPTFRLTTAQYLIDDQIGEQDRDQWAHAIAHSDEPSTIALNTGPALQSLLQRSIGVPPGQLRWGRTTQAEIPLYEVHYGYLRDDLTETPDGRLVFPPGARARAVTVIVEHTIDGGMKVAGLGALLEPGWPPTVSWEPSHALGG